MHAERAQPFLKTGLEQYLLGDRHLDAELGLDERTEPLEFVIPHFRTEKAHGLIHIILERILVDGPGIMLTYCLLIVILHQSSPWQPQKNAGSLTHTLNKQKFKPYAMINIKQSYLLALSEMPPLQQKKARISFKIQAFPYFSII